MNKKEREQSLLGLFYPCCHRALTMRLDRWRKILSEQNQLLDVKEWIFIEFDFTKGKKQLVYYELARAISFGWHRHNNISQIAKYMATYSNLTNSENFGTKVQTIRQGINRQMKYFNKIRKERLKNGNYPIRYRSEDRAA